jgi:aspartokinase
MANCCPAKLLVFFESKGIPAKLADTRELIITDSNFGDAQPLEAVSRRMSFKFLTKTKIRF